MIVTRGLGRKATAGGPVVTFGLGLLVLEPALPGIVGPAFGGVAASARIQRDLSARLRARLLREDSELLELISVIVRVLR